MSELDYSVSNSETIVEALRRNHENMIGMYASSEPFNFFNSSKGTYENIAGEEEPFLPSPSYGRRTVKQRLFMAMLEEHELLYPGTIHIPMKLVVIPFSVKRESYKGEK